MTARAGMICIWNVLTRLMAINISELRMHCWVASIICSVKLSADSTGYSLIWSTVKWSYQRWGQHFRRAIKANVGCCGDPAAWNAMRCYRLSLARATLLSFKVREKLAHCNWSHCARGERTLVLCSTSAGHIGACPHAYPQHNAYNAHVNTSSPDSTMHNHVNLQVKWRDTALFKLCKCKNAALFRVTQVLDGTLLCLKNTWLVTTATWKTVEVIQMSAERVGKGSVWMQFMQACAVASITP